jgi:hypothetical protein
MTDELIEKLARAMCEADGIDPEARASGGPNDFAEQRSQWNGYAVGQFGPAWHQYRRKARLFLAARAAIAAAKGA